MDQSYDDLGGRLMEIGSFGLKGVGTDEDPIQPDFESGPTGPLGYVPALWEQISRTTLIITLRYHAE